MLISYLTFLLQRFGRKTIPIDKLIYTGNKAKISGFDALSFKWPKVDSDYVNEISIPIPLAKSYEIHLNYSSPTALPPGN